METEKISNAKTDLYGDERNHVQFFINRKS